MTDTTSLIVDYTKCPVCGGEADNGFDRELPPNPYVCTKCDNQQQPEGTSYEIV